MIKTGLFFGSFNPVHIGHLMIANYFYSFTDLEEIWMVVTPQNPWKTDQKLISTQHRVNMLKIATKPSDWLTVSDFEKDMKQPSYTFESLKVLRETHSDRNFVLLIGGDNSVRFHQWKKFKEILKHHEVWGFPRKEEPVKSLLSELKIHKAPQFEISSNFIRESIFQNRNMKHFMPSGVHEYILQNNLYSLNK